MQETVLIPGSGRSPGERMATYSSILAWKIPWTVALVGHSPWGRRVRYTWATEHTRSPSNFKGIFLDLSFEVRQTWVSFWTLPLPMWPGANSSIPRVSVIPSVKWVVEGFSDLICVQHNDCRFIVLQKQQLQRVPLSRHGRLDLIYGAPTLHQGLPEAARRKGTLHPQGSAPWCSL